MPNRNRAFLARQARRSALYWDVRYVINDVISTVEVAIRSGSAALFAGLMLPIHRNAL